MRDATIVDVVRRHAIRLDVESAAQRLLEAIDPGVSLVLIGEATHGTHARPAADRSLTCAATVCGKAGVLNEMSRVARE